MKYIYIYIKRRHQKSDPKVCRKHTRTAKRHNQEKEGLKEHEPPSTSVQPIKEAN